MMFTTLFEYFSVFQSLLKERRSPPTGRLSETFKESLGRGVSTPLSPRVRLKTTSGVSVIRFPPPKENDWLLLGVE